MSSSGLFRRSSVPQSATSTLDHSGSKETLPVTPHPAVSTGLVGIGTKSKKECFVFEPQQWRKTVCKNCFRTQPEHKQSVGKEDAIGGPTVILRRTDSAPSTTSLVTSSTVANQQAADSCTSLGATSFHDMKSGRDNNNKSSNILAGNAARAAARKIAAGQRSSEDHRSQTSNYQETRRTGGITNSGAQSATGMYSSASSIDARYIEELENDFFALEDKHEAALRERDELTAELEAKIRTTAELQATLEQYREKVSLLERRCLHMEEEIKSYRERLRLPESDQSPPSREPLTSEAKESSPSSGVMLGDVACSGELQQRLNEVEQLCQEVMEENEQLKEEVEEMQREIEEMHDHFQEDDRDAMRELQRDLEAANKSCRILQFKLRKAERRFEQCEAERANLEERLARLEAELYSEADVAHIRNLEEEIRVAKEVGVQLNNELDMLDERRAYFEEENRQLKEELQVSQNRRISVENELGRLRLEMEKVKAEKGILDKGPLQVTDKNRSRQASSGPSLSREASFEEQQLQRELEASRERETDLSEQLRFAEEEVRKLKRRVKEFQSENEMLSKKIDRIYATQPFTFSQLTRSAGDNPQTIVQKDRGPGDLFPQRDTPSGQPSQLSANQLENELLMARKQLHVVEEENVGLRSKVINYERDINVPHREVQRTQSRSPRSTQVESQEHENLREQLNLIQDHLARIEHERDRLDGENRRLRCSELSGKRVNERSSDFEAVVQENEALKQRMKEWDRKLRQISREVSLAGSGDRDHEWMEKYNDARETIKEQEAEVFKAKKRISDLQDENARLRAEDRKTEQRVRREREKNNSSSAHMSREVLAQEVKSLEEELDEVTSDLTAAREQACTAQLRVTYLEDNNSELRAEAERRERELVSYVFHLENKNQVYINLHQIVQERMEILQNEVDRLLGITPSDESMEASAESQVSALSTMSTGSDEVFEDQTENTKRATEIERQLRSRVFCLERLLKEEKSRSEIAEAQLEKTLKQNNISLSNTESHLKTRQLDQLKKELEEKDELLEAKEEQVANLRSRIDQSRKMNVALRALMEKDTEGEKTNAQRVEANVEIASYRKEIESARKEMQIIRNNLTQAEKIRERLIKDNRELQEELKLREDSIFEQDDEIERRNTELRILKANAESLQKELEQTKRDLAAAKTREASGSSGRLSAQIAQNERIRAELHETARELNDMKLKYEEVKRACTTAEEKFAQLSADTNQLKTALQEKDAIIVELNKGLQRSNEEVGQSKLAGQTALTEKINVERQLMETKNALALKEQECNQLQTRLHEASSSVRGVERLGSSQESGIGVSDSAGSRDGTLSRRSAEVDRLRRELSMMRSEKDELLTEIKRLRTKLDKRAAADEQGRRDGSGGLVGLPTGNAYAKAIAAQQTTTKISLLNEHIATLNRLNAELKLQNESLQNNMLEYQRRYRSLKEQYEGEQEAWLTERVVLESKAKEQEDRKVTIATTRKLLQETTAKLFELEKTSGNKINELQTALEKLENEKNSLESKLNQIEEHQKLPKVLQRFGPTVVSSRPGVLAAQSRGSVGETHELTRRLESTERTLCKLRNELNEVRSVKHTEKVAAMKEAESARQTAEQEAEDLRDRLLTMECYRQQAELFRHRQFEVEESAEREFKVWQEERDHLLYKAEEARVMVEQWCIQLQCRVSQHSYIFV
ncbi:M protein repeat protein [Paragonimus heterotremus]|uniref:M protein repeat protein n=1 Tax=Paragonimus heterotremus TaxID=100268 RepID=A0A8J4T4N3_9TREM|nr:M protein repeat protein [Paragonimus heterotremus]